VFGLLDPRDPLLFFQNAGQVLVTGIITDVIQRLSFLIAEFVHVYK
jgi:hypothetical protein